MGLRYSIILKGYFMVTYSVSCALGAGVFAWKGWYCVFSGFSGDETGVWEWDVSICCYGVSEVRECDLSILVG